MKKFFLILGGIFVLIMLSACGSNQTITTSDTTQIQENSNVQHEQYENDIKLVHDGKLTFAMSGLLKPLNYRTSEGELTGFDVEVGTEIANRIGLEPNPVTNPWETILQGLRGKKYDAIIGSMSDTEERRKQVDFTNPYYISGGQIFVAEDNKTIQSDKDLKDKTIGVVQASTWRDLAEQYSDNIRSYPSDIYALQDLPSGRVDAVITDKIVGVSGIQESNLKIKPVGEVIVEDRIAIAVNKDNPGLVKEINRAIEEMINDGTYEEISMKWFGVNLLE